MSISVYLPILYLPARIQLSTSQARIRQFSQSSSFGALQREIYVNDSQFSTSEYGYNFPANTAFLPILWGSTKEAKAHRLLKQGKCSELLPGPPTNRCKAYTLTVYVKRKGRVHNYRCNHLCTTDYRQEGKFRFKGTCLYKGYRR